MSLIPRRPKVRLPLSLPKNHNPALTIRTSFSINHQIRTASARLLSRPRRQDDFAGTPSIRQDVGFRFAPFSICPQLPQPRALSKDPLRQNIVYFRGNSNVLYGYIFVCGVTDAVQPRTENDGRYFTFTNRRRASVKDSSPVRFVSRPVISL